MARSDRKDTPGSWHHVVNRGVARRTIFEGRADYRFFLSRLARVGRLGVLEVHAYCLLRNHFHLLVRSPAGELAAGMGLVQKEHAWFFNRRRRRDGPLFRGRFHSRPIESETYWFTVLRYIDLNPVEAGLVVRAEEYPYGSARHYCRRGPRPRWLRRKWIEQAIMGGRHYPYDPERYKASMGRMLRAEAEIVERRLTSPRLLVDPLDRLTGASTQVVSEWLRERERLADGVAAGLEIATADTVLGLVQVQEHARPSWCPKALGTRVSVWFVLRCGLLRAACGLGLREMSQRLKCSDANASRRIRDHSRLVLDDDEYARVSARVLQDAIALDFVTLARAGAGRFTT